MNTKLGRVLLGAGLLVAACNIGAPDEPASPMTGASGASTSSGSGNDPIASRSGSETTGGACKAGQACSCSGALIGSTRCDGDAQQCDCSDCPMLPDEREADFEACGGDVFGDWRLTATDMSAANWTFANRTSVNDVCPGMLTEATPDPQLSLRLFDGGRGKIWAQNLGGKGLLLKTCVDEFWQYGCDSVRCTETACGTCECHGTLETVDSPDTSWERTETTLTIGDTSKVSFQYCVDGDELGLLTQDGSNIVLRLERGYAFGTPTSCETRMLAECPGGGCSVGRCVGSSATCGAQATQTDCLKNQGCNWNATLCGGRAATCEASDYGRTPGCLFTKKPPQCLGTQPPCDGKSNADCLRSPGCNWDPLHACEGTPTPCGTIAHPTCEMVEGCSAAP
jgi:hypothetical protein